MNTTPGNDSSRRSFYLTAGSIAGTAIDLVTRPLVGAPKVPPPEEEAQPERSENSEWSQNPRKATISADNSQIEFIESPADMEPLDDSGVSDVPDDSISYKVLIQKKIEALD